jgi:prepilin-type N-terminal cleavage/methylation domain-containing protein
MRREEQEAFTLAEVLITLGIIGVVAALTMPALVASYQKHVVETRLKKFYSVFMQTRNMLSIDGELSEQPKYTSAGFNNPDFAVTVLEYRFPDVKNLGIKKMKQGAVMAFPDGSGVYTRVGNINRTCNIKSDAQYLFCIDYKKCLELNELQTNDRTIITDPKNVFWLDDSVNGETAYLWDFGTKTRAQFKTQYCNPATKTFGGCATIIMRDGWKIEDDYPW